MRGTSVRLRLPAPLSADGCRDHLRKIGCNFYGDHDVTEAYETVNLGEPDRARLVAPFAPLGNG